MDAATAAIQVGTAFAASLAFGLVFHLRGKNVLYAAIGGLLGWSVYLIFTNFLPSDYLCYFAAGFAVSLYCEIMARVRRSPVTVFLVVSVIPLVPGADAYRTMNYCIQANLAEAGNACLRMAGIAGAIALGLFVASSTLRLFNMYERFRPR